MLDPGRGAGALPYKSHGHGLVREIHHPHEPFAVRFHGKNIRHGWVFAAFVRRGQQRTAGKLR